MGMDLYMTGLQAKSWQERTDRGDLPEINIAGTLFQVDIKKLEFREVGNPHNRMPIIGAKEEMGFSHFFFDTKEKNHYAGDTHNPKDIPGHVRIILLQPLKDLDPVGFARQQGFADNTYTERVSQKQELTAFSKEKQTEDLPVKRKGPKL
jgi:hypothetical protein